MGTINEVSVDDVVYDVHDKRLGSVATVASTGDYSDLLNKPTKLSDFENDENYLQSFTETDPTVPSWAKQSTKPSYTYSEVGAAAAGHNHDTVYLKNGDIADWAKASSKPSYTYSEVGAAASSHTHSQYQQTLTAGDNITIEGNVISASGGGTGAYNFTVGEDGHLYVQTTDETTNYFIDTDGHLKATV